MPLRVDESNPEQKVCFFTVEHGEEIRICDTLEVKTDSEKAIKARWDAAVKRSKFGVGKFEFEAAYYSTNPPKDLMNKTKNMTAMELMALAQGNTTQAGVMGTLVRQYDNLAFKQGKKRRPSLSTLSTRISERYFQYRKPFISARQRSSLTASVQPYHAPLRPPSSKAKRKH